MQRGTNEDVMLLHTLHVLQSDVLLSVSVLYHYWLLVALLM